MENKAIAITGMACMFPGAADLDSFWKNILASKSAIQPIPENRNIDYPFGEVDKEDEIICTHGGFLDAQIPFPPLEYGVMPGICERADPEQLLTLQMADRALKDSGIDPGKEDLSNTEIIVGRGGYLGGLLVQGYQRIEILPQVVNALHQLVPGLSKAKLAAIKKELNSCFEHLNTDQTVLAVPNISTGRIANRFNMMGANYTIDAACASALIATDNAVMSLRLKRCERAITGGIFLASNPTFWWLFSRLDAFSSSSGTWPFSKDADGMLAGEGIGILVLERLEDAVKAGRRIYAVIKGMGTASDGRGAGLLAPRKEGQLACLDRAYRDAGIDPQTVELLEGHGTATKVGDRTELEAINDFFGLSVDGIPTRALGSVKSMIGHTMPASGAASLIKTALSLYHKIQPPTLCKGGIADGLEQSQFYLNTEPRSWIHPPGSKRRAGVNAFGFGGINGHAVLEEYDEYGANVDDLVMDWPVELFLLAGDTIDELRQAVQKLLEKQNQYRKEERPFGLLSMHVCQEGNKFLDYRLAVIAENYATLVEKLQKVSSLLTASQGHTPIQADGIYFEPEPLNASGKIVFIFPGNAFPGLGDDYTVRLGELCLYLPCFRFWFDHLEKNKALSGKPYRFSTLLFSPTQIDHEKYVRLKKELRILDNSAAGVFVANAAGNDLMSRLGVLPDIITGTSLGEWSAAAAGGMIELEQIAAMSVTPKGEEIDEIKGAIGLTQCPMETLKPYLDDFNRDGVTVTCSMDLSPQQVVFAGEREAVDRFCKHLNRSGIWAKYLNLFPIHTPLCQPVADLVYRCLEGLRVSPSSVPVYSAATTELLPADAEKMRTLLADNAILPVQMRTLFSKLHDEGARIFVQLGGGGKIETPIHETIGDKPFTFLSLDVANRHPLHQLQHVVASLYAHHTAIKTDLLFDFRSGYLNKSMKIKNKRSEYIANLTTIAPRFQIENERIDLAQTTGETQRTAGSGNGSKPDFQSVQNTELSPTELEEFLSGQMDTMTRLYSIQKEDELEELSHFTNMLECQAQLLLSQWGHSPSSLTPGLAHRPSKDGEGKKAMKAKDNKTATVEKSVQESFGQADEKRSTESLPFIGKIETSVAHQKMTIRRKLSLAFDLFLKDHAFLPCPEHIKPPEEKLPTLPMAVALEIVSEAAQALFPGKTVYGLKNIRNNRWISLNEHEREKELVITVEVDNAEPTEKIEVKCTIAVAPDEWDISFAGTVLLADGLYAGDPRLCLDREGEATRCFETIDPKTLYRPGGLYHGPCFQGMEKILQVSDAGVHALLTVPRVNGFFADHSGDSMILPAQTIDVASQLICCYDLANQSRNKWVVPVSIEQMLRCGPSPAPGAEVQCRMMMRRNDSHLVEFDMLLESGGAIFLAITGWRDWRMKWSRRMVATWQSPSVNLLACKKGDPANISKNGNSVYAISPKDLGGIDQDWLARLYLNASEYGKWRLCPQKGRIDYLTRLIAVKDVSRAILQQRNIFLYPSQIAAKQISEERFSVQLPGDEPNPSNFIVIQTTKQENETVAQAASEIGDDPHGLLASERERFHDTP